MKINMNGYKLTRNGKPITTAIGEIKFNEYKGQSFKENGDYYYFLRKARGYFYYTM